MRSGDRVIGRSDDRKGTLTAETRRRGEENCHIFITETPRHREKLESPFSDYQITRSRAITRSHLVLKRAMQILRATLREIFDESAYDRFLQRTQRQRSVESYRTFMIERDAAAVTRPRCC